MITVCKYKTYGQSILNVLVLNGAVKEIRFSHDPILNEYRDRFLKQEWIYLQDQHYYSYLVEKRGIWYGK